MSLSFCSFSSGSSGNCYLVKTGEAAILIDAGISATRILKQLERTDTPREKVKALFLTHEHHDHITGARVLMKKLPEVLCYGSSGTLTGVARKEAAYPQDREAAAKRRISIGEDSPVEIEDITVRAFRTLHDAADPYGYSIAAGGKRIAVITDTGAVTEEMLIHIADADILVLEANHDTELLRSGRYPHYLKQRILGDYGHLSNNQTADALLRLFKHREKRRVVLLAHLSEENNAPDIAQHTVLTSLAREDLYTGRDLDMGILMREEASPLYRL